jgi:hypothetical protein
MAYKSILLSLNEINRMPQVLAAGRMLGTQFNAYVSGLYVVPAAQIYPGMGYVTVPDLIDANQLYYRDKQAGAKLAFEVAMTEGTCTGNGINDRPPADGLFQWR